MDGGDNLDPILTINDPRIKRTPYDPSKEKNAPTIFAYFGQLKLFLSSILFFTMLFMRSSKNFTVIYIGAAPGLSIPIIDKLFPGRITQWLLYDPGTFAGDFCKTLCSADPKRFKIYRQYFTEDDARELLNSKTIIPEETVIMFDHRTSDKSRAKMIADWKLSCDTIRSVAPVAAWIKLRFAWPENEHDKITGIRGQIFLEPATGQFSAESRMFCFAEDIQKFMKGQETGYNLQEYEQRMFDYNLNARWQVTGEKTIMGLDHGNDVQIIIHTAKMYLRWRDSREPTIGEVETFVRECENDLGTRSLRDTPLAVRPDLQPQERIKNEEVLQAIHKERLLQDTKRGVSPEKKKCAKCGKQFAPKQAHHKFCGACSKK